MDSELLKELFYGMLKIRMVEEKIVWLYPEQEMRCPVHLCIGQEAIPVGLSANLKKTDFVLSNHRSHGHYIAKGGDLKTMFAEIYGKVTGCSSGKGGSMHLVDKSVGFLGATPIVASTIPIAVGLALSSTMQDNENVTVTYFGDGATEEGVLHESINFAVLKNLPVIFVCENNLYSVYSPLSVRQPRGRKITKLVEGHGIDCYHADGNDVIEVYKLAKKVIANVRNGGGPSFLEFETYRFREHCGPFFDNDLGYRTVDEYQAWEKRCPVEKFKRTLLDKKILTQKAIDDMSATIQKDIDQAVTFAKESEFPEEDLLLEHIYAR